MSARRKACGSRWRTCAYAKRGYERIEHASDGASVFDELVVDDWLHLEQMDARTWWLALGGARFFVTIRRNGTARVFLSEGAVDKRGYLVAPPWQGGFEP